MMSEYIKTVVFDFDGVVAQYEGYKGADVIDLPPVPGIADVMGRLRWNGYRVVVVSTRCATSEGMGAVRRFLRDNNIPCDEVMAEKPPAICYVDDRAICFNGDITGLYEKIVNYHSWTEHGPRNDAPVNGLRPCKAVIWKDGERQWIEGHFHRWGCDYEEFETGPGNYTTALIELDNGNVVAAIAHTVKFLDR